MRNRLSLMILPCFLLLCHFMPIAVSAKAHKDNVTTNLQTYVNQEKKYSIKYPSEWTEISDVPYIDLFLVEPLKSDLSASGATMNVISYDLDPADESLNLGDWFSESLSMFSAQDPNIKSGKVTLDGIPSKWISYTNISDEGHEVKILQYLIIAQNKKYIITLGSLSKDFSDYRPLFKKIASSFRLL